jgi:hypothetical protein
MMVAAKERFTLLGCDYKGNFREGSSERRGYSNRWTIYLCPTCSTETGFEWSDFSKHVRSAFSNLIYQDRQAIEREAAPRLTDENAFADFYRPGCKGAVRVYFRCDEPERSYGLLDLKIVIERAPTGAKPN